MASQSNQSVFVKTQSSSTAPLKNLKWVICVDISGSTADKLDNTTVLGSEVLFAKRCIQSLSSYDEKTENPEIPVIAWDTTGTLRQVANLDALSPNGGTKPACIFENRSTASAVNDAEAMLLLTDGAIDQGEVTAFGKKMLALGCHLRAIVGVLVGKRHDLAKDQRGKKPSEINVSVLVPAMLSDSCILYNDNNKTYVMWSTGAFKTTWTPVDIDDSTKWSDVTCVGADGKAELTDVVVTCSDPEESSSLRRAGYIPFGQNTFFSPTVLLNSSPSWDDLQTYPFDKICQYFKVTEQYQQLIDWFKIQKVRLLSEFLIDTDEKANFDNLVSQMNTVHRSQRRDRSNMTVSAYLSARDRTVARRYIATDEDIEFALADPRAIRLMQFFRDLMEVMQEDVRVAEEAPNMSYSTGYVSSSRYTSVPTKVAKISSGVSAGVSKFAGLSKTITASFDEPYLWSQQFARTCPQHVGASFDCSICFESSTSVPFVLLRKKINSRNLSDVSASPNTYFYPALFCAKCADYFCHKKQDPVRSPCVAALPVVDLVMAGTVVRNAYFEKFSKLTNQLYVPPPTPLGGYGAAGAGYGKKIGTSLYNTMSSMIGSLISVSSSNSQEDDDAEHKDIVDDDQSTGETKLSLIIITLGDAMRVQFGSAPEATRFRLFVEGVKSSLLL